LDARQWRKIDDFYDALLEAIEAPAWHGRNINALADSVCNRINALEPPFSISISHADALPEEIRAHIGYAAETIQMVREDVHRRIGVDVEVSLVLSPNKLN
jgi:RNAse (barnase) inhibitor barstar